MDLSIIIVNFNTKDLTQKCVRSIFDNRPECAFEVIVVDNGSEEKPALKNEGVRLIENQENRGFAKAVNQGIKAAKGKYILLLNSDAAVTGGSVDKLLQFAKDHPDAGAVGPKLINPDKTLQGSVYHFPSAVNAIREYWFGIKGAYEKYAPPGNVPAAVDAIVMTALLITPVALRRAGVLDERYFMYFEDLDYARRIKRAGLKSYYLPEAVAIHHHGASGRELADAANQWRRLIPGSKIYHGAFMHYLIGLIIRLGQTAKKIQT